MFMYAQIDNAGVCYAVSQLSAAVVASDMIPLVSYDVGVIGKTWDGVRWVI